MTVNKYKNIFAFTLTEVLIAFGIIGIVAALTIPTIVEKYQQKVTIEKLKFTYATLLNTIDMSVVDNGLIEGWDFTRNGQIFFDTYINPYLKNTRLNNSNSNYGLYLSWSNDYLLANGTVIRCYLTKNSDTSKPNHVMIKIDINGDKGPNVLGKDKFAFLILPKKNTLYNNGLGNSAKNISRGGLYPDGFGFAREELLNDIWRGCKLHNNSQAAISNLGQSHGMVGTYCTALIILDNWKIMDDYSW